MARYTNEMRERAVRMVAEVRPEHPHETAALRHVAGLLGMNTETLRLWVHRAEVDAGKRPGTTTKEAEEIKRLKREVAELRRANEILKSASVFFAKELDRPTTR
ncbi:MULTISPECIES: transposase [Nocardioides]|uniref:Transposase n=1 Tax=Nocardioides vastitatis TaxID=2568655 RepID=A0ABW0ZE90_9ACTN|nr:transposase [Nocardioides sp.]